MFAALPIWAVWWRDILNFTPLLWLLAFLLWIHTAGLCVGGENAPRFPWIFASCFMFCTCLVGRSSTGGGRSITRFRRQHRFFLHPTFEPLPIFAAPNLCRPDTTPPRARADPARFAHPQQVPTSSSLTDSLPSLPSACLLACWHACLPLARHLASRRGLVRL